MARRLTVFGPGHPFRGGIARTTTELVRALAARGHDVLFLSARRQYPRWVYPGVSDRDADACPPLEGALPVLDPFDPTGWWAARRLAVEHAADAWMLPYWTWAWAGLWWFLLATEPRPPALAVVHNPADHDAGWLQHSVAERVLGRCQGLFTHAEVLARQLEGAYPGLPVRCHRLPAVVDGATPDRAAARAELGIPDDRRVALFLGLIRPYKGVEVLLDAASRLPESSDWLVVVTGEPWGGLGERLERQAAEPGLGGRVRLDLGWVAEPRVPVLLAAADVVVLPYLRGSQSAVAPMALAHGVPVLTTAIGGVPEVVADGVNGVVVPPGDPEALADALAALDRTRIGELAAGARRSRDELTWSGYAASVEGLVEALGSSPP
jgi:glycosyltransferase involved in cell wall biosynthesis